MFCPIWTYYSGMALHRPPPWLESYAPVAEAIARLFHPHVEVVVHDLAADRIAQTDHAQPPVGLDVRAFPGSGGAEALENRTLAVEQQAVHVEDHRRRT